jgi:hypothetical protein
MSESLPLQTAEALPIIDVAGLMETRGYFVDAPRAIDIAQDQTRTSANTQNIRSGLHDAVFDVDEYAVTGFTESEGPQNLLELLDALTSALPEDQQERIEYFKEKLTFIGQKEFDEAVQGLAGYIFVFAGENPDTKICLPVDKNRSEKSEGLVANMVVDEIIRLAQQEAAPDFLVDYNTAVRLPSDEVQFFLLDDWSVSGHDMGA